MNISFESRSSDGHIHSVSSTNSETENEQEEKEQLVGLFTDEAKKDIGPDIMASFWDFSDIFPDIGKALLSSTLMVLMSFIPHFFTLGFISQVPNQYNPLGLVLGVGIAQIWLYTGQTFLLMSLGDSLCIMASKAFGVKNPGLASSYFYKSLFLGLLITTSNCLGTFLAGPFFTFFQIDLEIIGYAVRFLRYSMVTSFLQTFIEIGFGFLTAMRLFYPVTVCRLLAVACQLICGMNLVLGTRLELFGLAVTNFLSYTLELASLLIYVMVSSQVDKNAFSFSRKASIFKGLWWFLIESSSIGAIFYMEVLSMLVVFLVSGLLHDQTQLNTLVVLFPLISAVSFISLGLGYAGRSYVNNLLGKGHQNKSKLVIAWLYAFALAFSIFESGFCFYFRGIFANLITDDGEVRDLLVQLLLAYLPTIFNQNMNQINSLVMKSFERQLFCMVTYALCFFLMTPLLAYGLAVHTSLGSYGIILALSVSSSICNLVLFVSIVKMDWDFWFRRTQQKMEEIRSHYELPMLYKKEI